MFLFGNELFLLEGKHGLFWRRDWSFDHDVLVWIPTAVLVKVDKRSLIYRTGGTQYRTGGTQYRIGGTEYPILHRLHTSHWPQLKN